MKEFLWLILTRIIILPIVLSYLIAPVGCAKKQVISLDDGIPDHSTPAVIMAPPPPMPGPEDREPAAEPTPRPTPRPTPNDRGS